MKTLDLSQFKGTVAIVAAAGHGARMQSELPKQYLKINQQAILDITLSRLLSYSPIELVVLVISPDDEYFKNLENTENEKIVIIEGGQERADSVHNALCFLYDCGLPDEIPVMVHDAARPCITHADLSKLAECYSQSNNPCVLVAPLYDSIDKVSNGFVEKAVDRQDLVRAFTPQMASFVALKTSLKKAIDKKLGVTDEVSALIAANYPVATVIGRSDNIKITRPEDLALVEFYLEQQIKESQSA